jgi:hypothetical protein
VVPRQIGVALALAALIAAAAPTGTHAYRVDAHKWPGGVVRYYNAAPDQAWAVSRAVSAWNGSGATIHFVAVSRESAQLVIEEQSNKVYCAEGRATVGYGRGAHVVIFPAHGITHACNRFWAAHVMAHELGHVLGLLHEDRVCAVMNSTANLRGGRQCAPEPVWEWRCRLLEPDDVAGAVAIYGGTPRVASRQEECPLYKAISRPGALAASYDPAAGVVRLSFQRPAAPAIPTFVVPSPWSDRSSFALSGPLRTCSTKELAPTSHWRWHARQAGAREVFPTVAVHGRNCYALWAVDKLGRPSDVPATVFVTVE